MENNQTNSKKSNRGGARPGAGRPRKSNEPLSREDQIKILQDKLRNCGPRHAAAIARRIALLQGTEKPYCKTPAEQLQRDRALTDDELPKWWTDSWARIYISERACRDNSHAYNTWKDQPHIKRHLDAFEADWAKSEGITVQELRDALRKQDSDYHAQHSDAEILAMCRAHLETLRHSAA